MYKINNKIWTEWYKKTLSNKGRNAIIEVVRL